MFDPKTLNTVFNRVEHGPSNILGTIFWSWAKKNDSWTPCHVSLHPQVPLSHEIFSKWSRDRRIVSRGSK
jgi:hypothetical protein